MTLTQTGRRADRHTDLQADTHRHTHTHAPSGLCVFGLVVISHINATAPAQEGVVTGCLLLLN